MKSTDVLEAVKTKINTSSDTVQARVIELLAEREIASRVDTVDQALTKLVAFKKEQEKIKPDVSTFNEGGTETKVYSKAKFEEKKKLDEKIAKLEAALDKALELAGEFGKLVEVMKSMGNDKKPEVKAE
jgi:tripartite-type tricarboxylate transporter receptor subunit TctC